MMKLLVTIMCLTIVLAQEGDLGGKLHFTFVIHHLIYTIALYYLYFCLRINFLDYLNFRNPVFKGPTKNLDLSGRALT